MEGQATLIDVVKDNSGHVSGTLIDAVGTVAPEWSVVPAEPIEGQVFKGEVITEYPTGGFRKIGAGRKSTKGRTEMKAFNTYVYNPSWSGERTVLKRDSRGEMGYMARQATIHSKAAAITVGEMFYYGDSKSKKPELAYFDGLHKLSGNAVDAGGAADDGEILTSAFAARLDIDDGLSFALGENGEFETTEPVRQIFRNADGEETTEWHQEMLGYIGLKTMSPLAVGRISNISDKSDDTHILTDDRASKLIANMGQAFAPTHWFMRLQAGYLLAKGRGANATTGERVEIPKTLAGLPIVYTDSIQQKEAKVTGI